MPGHWPGNKDSLSLWATQEAAALECQQNVTREQESQNRKDDAVANFLEVLNAVTTSLGGLAQLSNEAARRRQTEDLAAANILRQTGDYTFEPTTAVQSPGILGALLGAPPRGVGGANIVKLGQNFYELRPYRAPDVSALLTGGIRPADLTSPPSPGALSIPPFVAPAATPSLLTPTTPGPTTIAPLSPAPQSKAPTTLSDDQQRHADLAASKSAKYNIKYPNYFVANLLAESSLNPNTPDSKKGAQGIAQFMPETWAKYGEKGKSPYDTDAALEASAKYWRDLEAMFPDKPQLVVAAYNAGEKAVKDIGGIPNFPETRQHVNTVVGYAPLFKQYIQLAKNIVAGPGAIAPPTATTTETPDVIEKPTPTSIPQENAILPRQEIINQRRVEAVGKNPTVSIVNTTYGPVTEELALQAIARNKILQTLYPKGREGQAKLVEAVDKNWKDMVALSDKFLRLKEQSAEKYPHVAQAIRQAKNLGELEGILANKQSVIDVNMAAYAGILDASRLARERQDWSIVGQAMNHYRSYGVSKETIEQARVDSGYAAIQEGQKAATVTKATSGPQAEAAGLRVSAEEAAKLKATGGFRDQDEIREAQDLSTATDTPIEKFSPKMRQMVRDRAIASKGRETRILAEERALGERVIPKYDSDESIVAEELLNELKQQGKVSEDADLRSLQTGNYMGEIARRADERKRKAAVELKQAQDEAFENRPVSTEDRMTKYINIKTGEPLTEPGKTPRELFDMSYVPMDVSGKITIRKAFDSKFLVARLKLLALGGKDVNGILGTKGAEIPAIFTSEGKIGNRVFKTIGDRYEAAKQDEALGQYVKIYEQTRLALGQSLGRVYGGDAGHVTENDRIYNAGLFPEAALKKLTLQDTKGKAEKQFGLMEAHLDEILGRATGRNQYSDAVQGMGEKKQAPSQETPAQRQERTDREMQNFMEQERQRRQGQ